MQSLGLNARFIITNSEGNIRLTLGSQPTIDLAKMLESDIRFRILQKSRSSVTEFVTGENTG